MPDDDTFDSPAMEILFDTTSRTPSPQTPEEQEFQSCVERIQLLTQKQHLLHRSIAELTPSTEFEKFNEILQIHKDCFALVRPFTPSGTGTAKAPDIQTVKTALKFALTMAQNEHRAQFQTLQKKIQDATHRNSPGASHVSQTLNLFPGEHHIQVLKNTSSVKDQALDISHILGQGSYKKVSLAFTRSALGLVKIRVYAEPNTPTQAKVLEHDCSISHILRDELGIKEVLKIQKCTVVTAHESPSGAIMEYCDQGTFLELIQKNTPQKIILALLLEFTKALAKMHAHGYCHLDLKLENILIKTEADGLHIRIGDLDTCSSIGAAEQPNFTIPCGTFWAPELQQHFSIGHPATVSPASDLWVLGDLLYACQYGSSLLSDYGLEFDCPPEEFQRKMQNMQNYIEDKAERHPNSLNRTICALFSSNPAERPSAASVASTLERWLQQAGP